MKMEVPQVDLTLEVLAWTKVTDDILNIYKQSCRLQACIFAICTEGTMKVSINLLEYEVHPNDLITLLPGTIIQFREKAEKGKSLFCRILREMYRTYQLADHHRERLSQADRTADHPSFREYRRLSEGIFCLVVSCQL